EDRGRDGGGQGSGGYPQQQGYPEQPYQEQPYQEQGYQEQGYHGQGYRQPGYGEQDYRQPGHGEQDYRQQERGGRGRWDDEAPAYGDPYDRGYGRPGADAGQPDPRQTRPAAPPGGLPPNRAGGPGRDDQSAGYGSGPYRGQPGGGTSRS